MGAFLAASLDPQLYGLLGLVDALRVGRIREQQLAAIALQERLGTTAAKISII